MSAYYNEHDPKAAAWLRELIKAGLIADGEVDERSVVDVRPTDLSGCTQVHLFAGIGGWSCALRLAGWPDSRHAWTVSCPCQPFSAAGKGEGFADERHLWPSAQWLIKQCRPEVIFGEQVESAITHGWLDLVQDDLEGEGYAFWAVALPAASVGAPHGRHRIIFVADSGRERCTGERLRLQSGPPRQADVEAWRGGEIGAGFWDAVDWLPHRDGKARPVEPGTFPLAHGVPARVVRLRGYGNAIVPQLAAAFIEAYEGVRECV